MNFLQNAEGYNITIGEHAYCGICGNGIEYKITNGNIELPIKCNQCGLKLEISKADDPKGNIIDFNINPSNKDYS